MPGGRRRMLDKYVSQSCLAAITNGEAAMGRIPFASLLPLVRYCVLQAPDAASTALERSASRPNEWEHVLEVPGRLGPRQFNSRRLLGPCAGLSVRWLPFLCFLVGSWAWCGGDCSRLAAATARRENAGALRKSQHQVAVFSSGDYGSLETHPRGQPRTIR